MEQSVEIGSIPDTPKSVPTTSTINSNVHAQTGKNTTLGTLPPFPPSHVLAIASSPRKRRKNNETPLHPATQPTHTKNQNPNPPNSPPPTAETAEEVKSTPPQPTYAPPPSPT